MRFWIWVFRFTTIKILWLLMISSSISVAQIENVPVNNQVYEFLNRMGVKGILPKYSNTMLPLSRRQVAELIQQIEKKQRELSDAEIEFLHKFEQEFMHEINPPKEDANVLFRDGKLDYLYSDKEKYLYEYTDSSVSLRLEFIGTIEHRSITGNTYGNTGTSFEEHGGRIRGTIKNRLGYYLQATNGILFGNKNFALSDPRLSGNIKFKDLNSTYFDFTEAYLRADIDWFNIQFGREYTLIGTGYSDRLLVSNNAPVFDLIKLDFDYKSFKFVFLQGSLVNKSSSLNKYLALHRAQFSLFDLMNIGISEMIIYQRYAPDFAYLNPINFYKSSEHSLHDRDNAIINFDLEVFPYRNYKLYGTWLIDDIDFEKLGTGWWGNQFGWQGGLYIAELGRFQNFDGVIEYTRLEPYVYSNRLYGNEYSHNAVGLGYHLEPNSDEWFFEIGYRPTSKIRTWLNYRIIRHGGNYFENGKFVNVGGNILEGHQDSDSEYAKFLDGKFVKNNYLQLRASYEPITNLYISGIYEFRHSKQYALNLENVDHYLAIRFHIEY